MSDFLQSYAFPCSFSSGDFVTVHQGRESTITSTMLEEGGGEEGEPTVEEVLDNPVHGLFSCPNAGCVKVYQRHSSMEKHLSFGKCKLVPEKDTLLDKAKKLYQTKLIAGTSAPATIQGDTTGKYSVGILPEGWALKSPKKATRFNEAQKHYLEEKFNLGQETGHKLDPAIVARDMRYARNKDGTRQFKMIEFMTPNRYSPSSQGNRLSCATGNPKMIQRVKRTWHPCAGD